MASSTLLRISTRTGLAAFALLGVVAAQDRTGQLPVTGPVAGFVFDRSSGIRPVLGVPGAATVGHPVPRTSGLGAVVFSPNGDYALALTSRGGQVVLLRDLSASAAAASLPVSPGATRVAVSPSGDRAVLYHPEAQSVSVLTGLPDAPAVSWSASVPYLPGGLAALAVSDGGTAALIVAAGAESPVWLLTPAAGARFVAYASSSPSLAFLPRRADAVIGDGGTSVVVLVRDPLGQAETTQIGGPSEGLSRPVAVEVTADGSRVLVADAALAAVISLSLAGEPALTLPCNCEVTTLERLWGGNAFRLSEPGKRPLWLLDTAGASPRIVFVPDPSPEPRRDASRPLPVRGGGGR